MNNELISKILEKQNSDGSWSEPTRFYNEKYKGTVWNLIVLAELYADPHNPQIKKACEFILSNSYEPMSGGFSTQYSVQCNGGIPRYVIPCLTGNMVFSLIRLGYLEDERIQKAIQWILNYQRADDGIYLSHVDDQYKILKTCFGKHTCFMGLVKALKALAEIPSSRRTNEINQKIKELVEFLLTHHIYKKSHDVSQVSKPGWLRFGFPLMYQTDILEIMDIMRKLEVKDERLKEAVEYIQSVSINGEWILQNTYNGKMSISIEKKGKPSVFLTEKANNILSYYTEY